MGQKGLKHTKSLTVLFCLIAVLDKKETDLFSAVVYYKVSACLGWMCGYMCVQWKSDDHILTVVCWEKKCLFTFTKCYWTLVDILIASIKWVWRFSARIW